MQKEFTTPFKEISPQELTKQMPSKVLFVGKFTGKNNRFPILDILEYLKNTHKNPKFGKVRPNQGIPNHVPWLGLVSLFQIWDFCGYS